MLRGRQLRSVFILFQPASHRQQPPAPPLPSQPPTLAPSLPADLLASAVAAAAAAADGQPLLARSGTIVRPQQVQAAGDRAGWHSHRDWR